MASRTNIYDQLKRDHKSVMKLLEEMIDSKPTQKVKRQEMVAKLKQELLAHAHVEERLLYSELERHEESRDLALEAEEEHHAVETLLLELEKTAPDDDHWQAKATLLREMLAHHIEEEENEMFESAQEVLDTDFEQALAQQFQKQKREEMKRL